MLEISGCICQPPEGYIVIVVARFNKSITQRLLDGAIAKLRQHNVQEQDIRVVWVPGAYETPFVASYFARDEECLAVICLGAVIKGETSHDQHINRAVSMALWEISSKTGTPVIFGILTCDNIEQANARSGLIESAKDKVICPAPGNKGAEAAEAALEMIDLMTELPVVNSDVSSDVSDVISKLAGLWDSFLKKQGGIPFFVEDIEDDEDYDDDCDDEDCASCEFYEDCHGNKDFPGIIDIISSPQKSPKLAGKENKPKKKTTKKQTKKQTKKKKG
ncbi:MAG: 6,7-dimethyl-8-ribityllumazine synthase [Planctomycetaceae bacterium]|jgi:6,7-dimethyl-8-ribityllumazine synthase|nr:6,7-dimethyl-8-ribityllumazine synthase [Planctomycetaceae bacterium]